MMVQFKNHLGLRPATHNDTRKAAKQKMQNKSGDA